MAPGCARGQGYIALPGLHKSPGRAPYFSEGDLALVAKISEGDLALVAKISEGELALALNGRNEFN